MKPRTATACLLTVVCSAHSLPGATSAQLYVDKLNTADGIGHPAGGAAWALIYDQNNDLALPGGLTDGSSLTVGAAGTIIADFEGDEDVIVSAGSVLPNGDRIIATGTVPTSGVIDEIITFDIGNGTNQVIAGRRFALYWFPGLADGGKLDTSGVFSIGGFFEISPHAGSFSDYGMTVPDDGGSGLFLAFDSAAGWDENRLVAIIVPETSTLTLSALGLAALLRRRRK